MPQISTLGSFLIQRQGHFCIKSYGIPQRWPCTCMVWLCKLLLFGLKERTMWRINCLGARKSRSEDYKKLALLLWSTIFHCSVWWYWCSLSKLNFGNKYTRFHLCCFSIWDFCSSQGPLQILITIASWGDEDFHGMLGTSLDPSLGYWRSHFQKVMRVKMNLISTLGNR